eukprot:13653587-Ditylum_brightwellii.AAC.1
MARWDDIMDTSKPMSILPNLTIHLNIPISDWWYALSIGDIAGVMPNSGLYDALIGVSAFTGMAHLGSFLYSRYSATFFTAI